MQRSEDFVWGNQTVFFFFGLRYIIYEAGNYLDHFLESKKVVRVAVFEGMNYSCHMALFITLLFLYRLSA